MKPTPIFVLLLVNLWPLCQSWTVKPASQTEAENHPRSPHHAQGSLSQSQINVDDYSTSNCTGSDTEDTIRVRIWCALASGEELTLQELGRKIGHHKDIRSHLKHVAKQAETLKNKSSEWKERRGLPTDDQNPQKLHKLRLRLRQGKRNETLVQLR